MQKRKIDIVMNEFTSGRINVKATFDPPIVRAAGDRTLSMNFLMPILKVLTQSPDVTLSINGVNSGGNHPDDVPMHSIEFSGTFPGQNEAPESSTIGG